MYRWVGRKLFDMVTKHCQHTMILLCVNHWLGRTVQYLVCVSGYNIYIHVLRHCATQMSIIMLYIITHKCHIILCALLGSPPISFRASSASLASSSCFLFLAFLLDFVSPTKAGNVGTEPSLIQPSISSRKRGSSSIVAHKTYSYLYQTSCRACFNMHVLYNVPNGE